MSRTYVILGGNGVFGIHVALFLLKKASPKKVICVGRNPEKPEPFTLNLGHGDPRYCYAQIHIGFESDRLLELLDAERPDVIINFAAQGEGATSWKYSWRYFDTNATALARVVEELMKRDYLERWIQIGTSELYGSVDHPAKETDPLLPSSPYAASKAAADMYLQSVSKVLGFPMNILRPSNAYGPGQQLHRIIPRAVLFGLQRRKLTLYGGGVAEKSYIHAQDLARAIHLVAEKAPLGTIYNVGPKAPIAIKDLVAEVAGVLEIPLDDLVEIAPPRLGEDLIYWLDSSAIEEDVGWRPEITIKEGLHDMVVWGRKYLPQLSQYNPDFIFRA
jgi:dTDP-glucose 4,6-dehydratase